MHHPQQSPAAIICAATIFCATGCEEVPASSPAAVQPVMARTTDAPPPPATPGGHSLAGTVQVFESSAAGPADLCVQLLDPEPLALGGEAAVIESTTTDASGAFAFSDLPVPPTIGWVLVVDACGETDTWVATGTVVSGEMVGGRGAADSVSVTAWLLPTETRDILDAGLEASGSSALLADGGLVGHSLGASGAPHQDSWVRGPLATQIWYPHESGTYELFDGTEAAEGGLYIAPAAERVYGVWVGRVSGEQFEPLMAGGLPGVVIVYDFVSWTPRVSSPP